MRRSKSLLLAAMFTLIASVASASTILQFTEVTFNNPFHITANGTGSTTITAVNVPVNVTFDTSFCLNVGCNGATNGLYNLNLTANSTSLASVSGTTVTESFGGVISLTNGGINLLSVTFTDIFSGPLGASSNISMGSAQPPDSFSGSSNVFDPAKLGIPRGFALSFSDFTSGLSLNGNTINSATADASGTFNATPLAAVPEPGSLVLLGTGLLGFAKFVRRRR